MKEKAETTTTRQRSDTKVHNSGQDIGQVELDQENMPDLISVRLKVDHFYITLEINVSGSEIHVKSRSLLDLNDGNINLSKKVWHVGRFIEYLPPKLIAIENAKVVKNQIYDFTNGMTQSKIYYGNSKNDCLYLILLVHESESDNHDKSDEKKMKLFLKNLHTENIKEYWPHKWIANTIGKEVTNMENYLIWQLSANSYFYDRMKSKTKKDLSIEMESYVFKISNEKFNLTFKKNLHPKTDTHEMRQVTANIIAGKKFKIKISNANSTIYQILETNNDEKMLLQCKIQLFWRSKNNLRFITGRNEKIKMDLVITTNKIHIKQKLQTIVSEFEIYIISKICTNTMKKFEVIIEALHIERIKPYLQFKVFATKIRPVVTIQYNIWKLLSELHFFAGKKSQIKFNNVNQLLVLFGLHQILETNSDESYEIQVKGDLLTIQHEKFELFIKMVFLKEKSEWGANEVISIWFQLNDLHYIVWQKFKKKIDLLVPLDSKEMRQVIANIFDEHKITFFKSKWHILNDLPIFAGKKFKIKTNLVIDQLRIHKKLSTHTDESKIPANDNLITIKYEKFGLFIEILLLEEITECLPSELITNEFRQVTTNQQNYLTWQPKHNDQFRRNKIHQMKMSEIDIYAKRQNCPEIIKMLLEKISDIQNLPLKLIANEMLNDLHFILCQKFKTQIHLLVSMIFLVILTWIFDSVKEYLQNVFSLLCTVSAFFKMPFYKITKSIVNEKQAIFFCYDKHKIANQFQF